MKKRIIALILALLMALSLAACGGGTDNDGAVHLTIWQPTDKEPVENWWVEKLAEWNSAHPDIQVAREAIDRSDSYAYDNKIATAVTSRQLPDLHSL